MDGLAFLCLVVQRAGNSVASIGIGSIGNGAANVRICSSIGLVGRFCLDILGLDCLDGQRLGRIALILGFLAADTGSALELRRDLVAGLVFDLAVVLVLFLLVLFLLIVVLVGRFVLVAFFFLLVLFLLLFFLLLVVRNNLFSISQLGHIAVHFSAHSQSQSVGVILIFGYGVQRSGAFHGAAAQQLSHDITKDQVDGNCCTHSSFIAHGKTAGIGIGFAGLGRKHIQIAGQGNNGVFSQISLDGILNQSHGDGSVHGIVHGLRCLRFFLFLLFCLGLFLFLLFLFLLLFLGNLIGRTFGTGQRIGAGNAGGFHIVFGLGIHQQIICGNGPASADTGIGGQVRKAHGNGCANTNRLAGAGVGTAALGGVGCVGGILVLFHTAQGVHGGTCAGVNILSSLGFNGDVAAYGQAAIFCIGNVGLGSAVDHGDGHGTCHTHIGGTGARSCAGGNSGTDSVGFLIGTQLACQIADHSAGCLVLQVDVLDVFLESTPQAFLAKEIILQFLGGEAGLDFLEDFLGQLDDRVLVNALQELVLLLSSGEGGGLALDQFADPLDDQLGDAVFHILGSGDGTVAQIISDKGFQIVFFGSFTDAVDEVFDALNSAEHIVLDGLEEALSSLLCFAFVNTGADNDFTGCNAAGKNFCHIGVGYGVDCNRHTDTGGGIGCGSVCHDNAVGIMTGGNADGSLCLDKVHCVNLCQSRIALNVQHHGRRDLDAAFRSFSLLTVFKSIADILGVHVAVAVGNQVGKILCGLLVAVDELVGLAFLEQGGQGFGIVVLFQLVVGAAFTKEVV